jgi:hypothetical protein
MNPPRWVNQYSLVTYRLKIEVHHGASSLSQLEVQTLQVRRALLKIEAKIPFLQ